MRIDIRFLQRLPDAFIRQSDELSTLREADADGDGFITEEASTFPNPGQQEASDFLRRLARERGASLSPSQLAESSRELMAEFNRSADSIRSVVETQTVSVTPLADLNPARRRQIGADFLLDQVDGDGNIGFSRNRVVDGSEMRLTLASRLRPEFQPLRTLLYESERDLYANERLHREDAVPTLFHVLSYIPRHILQPLFEGENVVDGLITGWNYLWDNNPSALRTSESSPYSWRGGLDLMAERRHIRRIEAIQHFEEAVSRHPNEDAERTLSRLSQDDQNILRQDLRISQLLRAIQAPNAQTRGQALVDLAQSAWEGRGSRFILEGGLAEFFGTRWYDDNEVMATSIYTFLADPNNGYPDAIQDRAREGNAAFVGNGRSFLSNLLPWHWGERWPARQTRFNYIVDQLTALGIELLIARGVVSGLRFVAGRIAWPILGWAGRGIWSGAVWSAGRLAPYIPILSRIAPPVAEATAETATVAATETATVTAVSGWRAAGALAWRGLTATGRGLDRAFRYGTYAAGTLALNHAIRPPGETPEINYAPLLSAGVLPPASEPTEITGENIDGFVLMNLVMIQLQINEQIRSGELPSEPVADNLPVR